MWPLHVYNSLISLGSSQFLVRENTFVETVFVTNMTDALSILTPGKIPSNEFTALPGGMVFFIQVASCISSLAYKFRELFEQIG